MALDTQGIHLAEITNKFPKSFQALGYDAVLDVDEYMKPKLISTFQLCINTILTLLFMKPGQYPSIPDLGIDIEQYLLEYSDDKNIPAKIITQLNDQCNRLQITGISYNCYFDKTSEGIDALVIDIRGTERVAYGSETNHAIIGITYDKLNRLYVRQSFI